MSLGSKIAAALKPEYAFQPRVLLRRLRNENAHGHGPTRFEIPGGGTIEALAEEEHGRILATLGVVDLPVTQALWRLGTRNETCLDVGANIGYMTGVLAGRMHGGGRIHCFEALPTIFEELERNVALLRARFPNVKIETHATAISSKAHVLRMGLRVRRKSRVSNRRHDVVRRPWAHGVSDHRTALGTRSGRVPHEQADWLPVSYVATADKIGAKALFTSMGWASLRGLKDG